MAHVVAQESAAMGANQTRVEEGFTEDPYLSEELLVLSSGKPIIEPWIANSTSALVQQFYPSEEGGNALADILFRDYNPSGRLSVNFPYDIGFLPVCYNYLSSDCAIGDSGHIDANGSIVFGHQYVIGIPQPWYPLGHGKSYSTFEYSLVSLDKANATINDTVTASVKVTNTSPVDGTDVVQLYIVDSIASIDVPSHKLKRFKKIRVKTGWTSNIKTPVSVQDIGLWNRKMKYVVEPAQFVVLIGRNCTDIIRNLTYVS
ncbi:unnamed protein product [Penicillium crustosum]